MLNSFLISKSQLLKNLEVQKKYIGDAKICAMVKADAYGIGLEDAVKILDGKVDFFGVSCIEEARRVKQSGKTKVLIVGSIDKTEKVNPNFSYACSSTDDIDFLLKQNIKLNIHLKINSGMNRYGFSSMKDFKLALKMIENSCLRVEGIFTHFATHSENIEKQTRIFLKYVKYAQKNGLSFITHADSSFSSIFANHKFDMVRVGYNLFVASQYGFSSPVKILTKVVQINKVKKGEFVGYEYIAKKNTTIAVLPIGYADGLLTNFVGMELNVRNCKCKIVNVCMDCCMLDIGNIKLKKGDEISVVDNLNPLTNYANFLRTNEYQILTLFSKIRAERILID